MPTVSAGFGLGVSCPRAPAFLAAAALIFLGVLFLRNRFSTFARIGSARDVIGIFHPHSLGGGGGERVLWYAIQRLHASGYIVLLYTYDREDAKDMASLVQRRFGLKVDPEKLVPTPLYGEFLLEPSTFPFLTILGQALGSIIVVLQGFFNAGYAPTMWIETTGLAFAYPIVRYVLRLQVASYTHYPIVSSDMLSRVQQRKQGHVNTGLVARSAVLTQAKLVYYRLLQSWYTHSLNSAIKIAANSSWTLEHLKALGVPRDKLVLCYPPCDVSSFTCLSLHKDPNLILSLAQFRPEKEQDVQLYALADALKDNPELRLVMAGSARHAQDQARVHALKKLAHELHIEHAVTFVVNSSFSDLLGFFANAGIGLHTMVDEHFGITVVEFMAAGLIPVAHASAGPLLDIVRPYEGYNTGYLATDIPAFSQALLSASARAKAVDAVDYRRIIQRSASRFQYAFDQGFDALMGGFR